MEIKLELNMVKMPNFISVKGRPKPRQEGFSEGVNIPIQDLSFEEASDYAENMRLAFIEHWKSKGGKVL